MNAILIDPSIETIELIQMHNVNDLEEMRRLIDCDLVELAMTFSDIQVDMFCDEEGWLRNREIFGFEFDGVLIPSKALVVGYTKEGKQAPLTTNKLTYLFHLFINTIEWKGELNEEDMPQPQVLTFEELLKQDSLGN